MLTCRGSRVADSATWHSQGNIPLSCPRTAVAWELDVPIHLSYRPESSTLSAAAAHLGRVYFRQSNGRWYGSCTSASTDCR